MTKFLFGFLLGLVLVPTAFYLYLRSGDAPVATSAQPMPFERFLVHTAMHATIDRQEVPIHLSNPSDVSLMAGAKIYRTDCAVCHGLPGETTTATARGMYPYPPQFFRPNAKKIDDPPGEVYWKVENGIRLTGMPAWNRSLNDTQVRELTGLLEDGTTLPASVIAVLEAGSVKAETQTPSRGQALPSRKGG